MEHIDKTGHKKKASCPVEGQTISISTIGSTEVRDPFDCPCCSSRGRLQAKMSALQTFLLVVDHNKDEARQIAEQVARGE